MPAQLAPFTLGVLLGLALGFMLFRPEEREASEAPEQPSAEEPASRPVFVSTTTEEKPARRLTAKTPIEVRKKANTAVSTEDMIAAHWEASIDAEWSEHAMQSLREDFERAETSNPFTVTHLDCRKTSCVAVIEWEKNTDPREEILGARYSLACRKQMLAPGRTQAGFRSTLLLFECARSEVP